MYYLPDSWQLGLGQGCLVSGVSTVAGLKSSQFIRKFDYDFLLWKT